MHLYIAQQYLFFFAIDTERKDRSMKGFHFEFVEQILVIQFYRLRTPLPSVNDTRQSPFDAQAATDSGPLQFTAAGIYLNLHYLLPEMARFTCKRTGKSYLFIL